MNNIQIKAVLRNLRITPRKSREVVDLIRRKDVIQARALLEFAVKKAAQPVLKLLNNAADSALKNFNIEDSDLYVEKIVVDEGPKLKRFHPMSRGRSYPITKRTSHITLVLGKKSDKLDKIKKVKKAIKNKTQEDKN